MYCILYWKKKYEFRDEMRMEVGLHVLYWCIEEVRVKRI